MIISFLLLSVVIDWGGVVNFFLFCDVIVCNFVVLFNFGCERSGRSSLSGGGIVTGGDYPLNPLTYIHYSRSPYIY